MQVKGKSAGRGGVKMAHRQVTSVVLGLALVAFLAAGCADPGKVKQLQNENVRLNQLIQQKDASLATLTEQAQAKQAELEAVKKELDITKKGLESVRTELDYVSKKLSGLAAAPAAPQQ
jgi:septal ring factor EnvC (AmiA/AmiB activator)